SDLSDNTATASTTVVQSDTTPPTVTIDQLAGSGATDTTSPFAAFTNDGATLTWHADENGTYTVRRGATSCSNGTVVASGSYSTSPADTTTTINGSSLGDGANTIRICVTDAASNTGSATTTVTIAQATISGTVYNDVNGDGTFNGADAGLVGVSVSLSGT